MKTLLALLLSALIVLPLVAVSLWTPSMIDANDSSASLLAPPADSKSVPAIAANAAEDTAVTAPTKKLSRLGYDITPYPRARVAELAQKLDAETIRVTQHAGTEPAFCGTLIDNHKTGTYCCVVCGLPLFSSSSKFNSGTGWPSFFSPIDPDHVASIRDNTHGMERIEIRCTRCASHLGHVFDDGPKPTGLRFCLNGVSLTFTEKGTLLPLQSQPVATETAYFAGGCFWGVEHYFQLAPGVISVASGYMQGSSTAPNYREVCEQDGVNAIKRPANYKPHAEAVKVVFDPNVITYTQLLEGFFEMHDPTTSNRQGPDEGTQYRSGLYTVSATQEASARAFVAQLGMQKIFGARPIVTEIESAKTFYDAEEYHQDYLEKNPTRGCHLGKPWWMVKQSKSAATAPAAR